MMGMKALLLTPVTALTLDDLVPADHFYRHLDRVLDLTITLPYIEWNGDEPRITAPPIDPAIQQHLSGLLLTDV